MTGPVPGSPPRPAARTTLLLVRHGETVWHADDRYAGAHSDIDLTPKGRRQAATLAAWAVTQPVDAVVVSPMRRAVETAQPSAAALAVALTIVEDLHEVDFGMAEGLTKGELRRLDAAMVDRFTADPVAHPYPGSESVDHAAERAGRALRALSAEHVGGTVLVVAHNTLLRLGMCVLLGLPVARYRTLFPRLQNAAVTEVSVPVDGSAASLLSLNCPLPTPSSPRSAPMQQGRTPQ